MENQKIIIALLVVIIAIIIVGFVILSPFSAKEDSNLAITDTKINEGDSLVVVLTDSKGNAITNETVNIKITDNEGTITDKSITTNSKGKAKFEMKEKGKYSIECTYDGNDKYASSSTAGNLTVKKVQTKSISQETSSSSSSSSDDEWVYGTGAGGSDDPNIHWKRNTRTGYAEYYNEKTGESWGGYNIA
ncbi:MAG: Ig-like domain-containing protein [Methanobrevibacter sp.]|nr:Ig-like domain-containing protein [Methanobrevibacter sp.]